MTAAVDTDETRLQVETTHDKETVWIVIHGEADIANVDHLEAALTGIRLDGTKSVRIDASDLTFFDVAALRRLLAFAQLVKQTGRDITTCRATPMLYDVARILELHDDLGLHRAGPIVP